MSDIEDVFGEPNGPAYEAKEQRRGVPLSYVAEKLRTTLTTLHSSIAALPDPTMIPNDTNERFALYGLRASFELGITSYLALSNMLGGLREQKLSDRLLTYGRGEFAEWLDRIDRGSVYSEDDR
jgi:hypothetical protein